MSDFARAAVMNQADLTAPGSLHGALLGLDQRIAEVAARVGRMLELLEPDCAETHNCQPEV